MDELDACGELKHFYNEEHFVEETLLGGSCEMLVYKVRPPSLKHVENKFPNSLDLILAALTWSPVSPSPKYHFMRPVHYHVMCDHSLDFVNV